MVVKVKLDGLNIRRARGKWYVSLRRTGDSIIKGFSGTREELMERLGQADILRLYAHLKDKDRSRIYPDGTLGALIAWFKTSPRWSKLSDASRADYEKSFLYLDPEADTVLSHITQSDIYDVQERAAQAKWGRFADKLVSHLSTMFRGAVKKRWMSDNPAIGIEKIHTADPNANHEWSASEVMVALAFAPNHLLTPLTIARFQGFRGQTCHSLLWHNFVNDSSVGKAFTLNVRKNNELAWFPCDPVTRQHLDAKPRTSVHICTNKDGKPWSSEEVMQGAISDYLGELKKQGLIRAGCTMHGLRVTYAAAVKRSGMDDGTVANALGDRSTAMGAHYTRHVEKEHGRLRAWRAKNEGGT